MTSESKLSGVRRWKLYLVILGVAFAWMPVGTAEETCTVNNLCVCNGYDLSPPSLIDRCHAALVELVDHGNRTLSGFMEVVQSGDSSQVLSFIMGRVPCSYAPVLIAARLANTSADRLMMDLDYAIQVVFSCTHGLHAGELGASSTGISGRAIPEAATGNPNPLWP